ncbi:NAD(P)H-hydrate dehydratase [Kordiimonas pumila]|uniref:Bifunctional NAD(P)H-hydrate repair enzyme n=1 Tax=Kordiimonas pumila TaxID=2161677 RepID=A0ABV7D2J5_9PROT|nr:NAD(P)H-hydrate dehydratase [Kordiimonas pumila]
MAVSWSSNEHVLLTPAEASAADAWAINSGVSGLDLMESAGRATAEMLVEYIGTPLETGGEIIVLCGPGNNGGDGFVTARYLDDWGYPVRVIAVSSLDEMTSDAAEMAEIWRGQTDKIDAARLKNVSVVVDCLFGTGLSRPIEEPIADLINKVNALDAFKLAVDLPSGLDGVTGLPTGACFQADATVTFSYRKPAHLIAPGRFYCGGADHVHVADIGLPEESLSELDPQYFSNEPSLWGWCFPFQGPETHKYDRGHLLVLGGKEPTLGASRLASMAALRAGAGLVTLAAPSETYGVQAAALTDVMVRRFDSVFGFIGIMADHRIGTVILGPGSGISEKTVDMVQQAGRKERNMVLDADVLSSMIGRIEIISDIKNCAVVLTPHEGEFIRLFPDLDYKKDRLAAVRAAAKRACATVVLKGVSTVVADETGRVSIATNAPSWLAVGGTGDVLSGIIGSLLVQGMPAFEAASAAVWMHGEAGMKAGRGMIASDLVNAIPSILPG